MKKVLVIGSTVADIIINIDYLPTSQGDVHVKSQQMSLGGCAYNVSDIIRHYNIPYILFSPIGTGVYGDFVRGRLAEKGIASPIPSPAEANGCCYCFVENSGERTFICHHGAEYLFKPEWFKTLDLSDISAIYVCGLEIEDKTGDIIIDFLEQAKGIPVFFAPGPRIDYIDEKRVKRLFALHPVTHLNKKELLSFTNEDNLFSGTKALFEFTKNTVIVTDGSKGASYYDGKEFISVDPVPAKEIVDTIGAGDSHIGGILASFSAGLSLKEALKKANETASLVVAQKGATVSDEVFAASGLRLY